MPQSYDQVLHFYLINICINNFNENKDAMLMTFKYAIYTYAGNTLVKFYQMKE